MKQTGASVAGDSVLPDRLEAVAQSLVDAYRHGSYVDAPSKTLEGFTKSDALAIAERVRALRIANGALPIGYKVGFTNPAVRAQFDAEAQLAATVYRETLATGLRVDARTLLGPRIEPEVVLGIGPDGDAAWAAFGFEIVQSHVADWRFGYLDAIADFGLHAALVIGERRPIAPAQAAALQAMDVELLRGETLVERGRGSDVDGGPLGSVNWLRTYLAGVGRAPESGELVSTGSLTRVPAIESGQTWTIRARAGELAPLTIAID